MHKISDGSYLLIYLILIALAEITVAYITILSGIIFHIILLFILFIHSGLISKEKMFANKFQWLFIRSQRKPSGLIQTLIDKRERVSSILLALTLVPLLRILSLVMPLYHFPRIQWFIIIGVAIYASLIILLFQQGIKFKEIGFQLPTKKYIPIEIGIIIFGIPLGFMEFYILHPAPFLDSFSLESIIIAILILFIATGLMEEIIFRGLLQKKSINILGPWLGILFVNTMFAVLHIGNLSILDVLLVFCIGGLYSLVVKITKTIIGVSISHTIVNIFLFIICPLFLF